MTYEVQMSEGSYGQWRTVSKYNSRTNFIGSCNNASGCQFRVRTEKECGSVSAWSGTTNTNPGNNQSNVNDQKVRTFPSNEGCGITIQWDPVPTQGGRANYLQVQVQSRSNTFYYTNLPCDTSASTTQCTVQAATLKASPYYLEVGDRVIAQVSVFYDSWKVTYDNLANEGEGAVLGSRPQKISDLKAFKVEHNNSIDVEWSAPNGEQG